MRRSCHVHAVSAEIENGWFGFLIRRMESVPARLRHSDQVRGSKL